jgi:thiamine-phosphate pyrophosphorylase
MTQIYLISPPKIIIDQFLVDLEAALQTKKIPVFQLRLKGYDDDEVVQLGKEILVVCRKYNTQFILNDRLDLALKIGADGVHFGDSDGNITEAKKKVSANFVIGASCYDSKHIAVQAVEEGADYVSFGAFFNSPTKNSKGNPTPEILEWCDEILAVPSVAIGGITAENCRDLVKSKADFLAVISYVWSNPKGVLWAVENLSKAIADAEVL